MDIALNPQARVLLLPDIGGFVGSDTLGAILGAPAVLNSGNHLLLDIGTNCELFLKTGNGMLACSTAAGPAFEGSGITCGMKAKPGAINFGPSWPEVDGFGATVALLASTVKAVNMLTHRG